MECYVGLVTGDPRINQNTLSGFAQNMFANKLGSNKLKLSNFAQTIENTLEKTIVFGVRTESRPVKDLNWPQSAV